MSALTKLEFERDVSCIEISLFAQCRALISEGMAKEVDQLIERANDRTIIWSIDQSLDRIRN